MKKQYFRGIFFFLSVVLLLVCCNFYYQNQRISWKETLQASAVPESKETSDWIETTNLEEENVIQNLKNEYQNKEVKALLSIENSNFSYPVVQTTDNDYYLTHNIQLEEDAYGAIYADYRTNLDTSHKILIYGHSSSKKETPFNTLENYYEEEYYKDHKYITLQTEQETYRYEIFSVYVETSDFTYMNLSFESKASWYQHLLNLQSKSFYTTNVELKEEDDILIMQTCSKHPDYKKNSKKYLLIVSRRV